MPEMSQMLAAQIMANMGAANAAPGAGPLDVAAAKVKNAAQNIGPAIANANYGGAPAQFMSGLQNLGGRISGYKGALDRAAEPTADALRRALTPQPTPVVPAQEPQSKQPNLIDFLKNYVNK